MSSCRRGGPSTSRQRVQAGASAELRQGVDGRQGPTLLIWSQEGPGRSTVPTVCLAFETH